MTTDTASRIDFAALDAASNAPASAAAREVWVSGRRLAEQLAVDKKTIHARAGRIGGRACPGSRPRQNRGALR